MLATVKIIPFAAPRTAIERGEALLAATGDALVRVAPFQPRDIGLVLTRVAGTKDSVHNPIYSHKLSLVGFWSLALFYPFAGIHHYLYSPIADWAETLAIITSMLLIVPVWTDRKSTV